ncbi:hypothetical protein SBADM41S_12046 [Streptomyces badius]
MGSARSVPVVAWRSVSVFSESTTGMPRASVHSSSSTAMSKVTAVTDSQTASSSGRTTASRAVKRLARLACVTSTPLGTPVEPEVKMTYADVALAPCTGSPAGVRSNSAGDRHGRPKPEQVSP